MWNHLLQFFEIACMKDVLNFTPALYRNWFNQKGLSFFLVCACTKKKIVPYYKFFLRKMLGTWFGSLGTRFL